MSTSPNRSSSVPLSGQNVSGNIYVFTSPSSGVSQVQFFLDDPDMSDPPIRMEKESPHDFAGTASSGGAQPFNTATVVNGSHTITARLSLSGGGTQVLNATFTSTNTTGLTTFTWSTVAGSPIARFEAQGAVANSKLYVFGGFINASLQATRRSDVYNPSTNTWTRITDMPEALTHAAVVVDGQTIYLVGGYVGNHPGPSTSHVWKYSIANNTWSAGPSLPGTRAAGGAVRLGRNLHFFGGAMRSSGELDEEDRNEHLKLFLDGGTSWSYLADLPNARNHLGGATDGSRIYAVGGQHSRDEESGNQDQVDIYNSSTNTWTRAADLPVPRGHISSSTFLKDGYVIVIGGTLNGNEPSADVTAYNPVDNKWTALSSLPQPRKSPVAGVIGGQIFSSTGNASSGATPTKTTYNSVSATAARTPPTQQLSGPAAQGT
ncbi:MAG: hypothetical protein H7Y22_10960 [Gemmatimonadaceae bacterium]|nr:hypothetical protein [Gloeobacterales cyanobacterium ES-bin-141]